MSISGYDIRTLIRKHLLFPCDIILHCKIRVNDIPLAVLLHAFG